MRFRFFGMCVCSFTLMACRDSSGPSGPTIRDYIVAVRTSVAGTTATYKSGSPPSSGGSLNASVTELGAFILGGTAPLQVTGSSQFSNLIVSIDGVRGYWDVSFPSSLRIALYLTLSQEPPLETFSASYAVGNNGNFGPPTGAPVVVKRVGTGEVQISASWDVLSDLDLHVVDPSGDHIYFGDKSSITGGRLDLDSNPACSIDRINNENITWPLNNAPVGKYTVYVNLYAACGTSATTYAVTVTQRGQQPQVYFGTVSAPATPNSTGRMVTTFTR